MSIKTNFDLLINLIDRFDLFQENPLEDFVNNNSDEILESWVFKNLNFEKINLVKFIENDKINQSLKNFILQDTVNKFRVIQVNGNKDFKNFDFDSNLILNNYQVLEELTFKNFELKDFQFMIDKLRNFGVIFDKVKKMKIVNSIFMNSDEDFKQKLKDFLPNLEQMCLVNSFINNGYTSLEEYTSIKKIKHINSSITTSIFNDIFYYYTNNLANLETLDLTNNRITSLNFKNITGIETLKNLKFLVLRKNNLHQFKSYNVNFLPGLKYLDLADNSFTTNRDFTDLTSKKNDKIIIFSKNPFILSNKENAMNYVTYLNTAINSSEHFLRKLDLSYVYSKKTCNFIEDLNFNNNLKASLKTLNIGYNSLTTSNLKNFFSTNHGFIALKSLYLNSNHIDDNFLSIFANKALIETFESLENLDISDNYISFKSSTHLCEIFNTYKKLTCVKVKNNKIENYIEMFLTQYDEVLKIFTPDDVKSFRTFFENLIEINKNKSISLVFNKKIHDNLESFLREPALGNILMFEDH